MDCKSFAARLDQLPTGTPSESDATAGRRALLATQSNPPTRSLTVPVPCPTAPTPWVTLCSNVGLPAK